MNYPLGIFAPVIGGQTETFIHRHMQELLPGRTVVIAETAGGRFGGKWSVDCPSLVLNQIHPGRFRRWFLRGVGRRLGWEPEERVAFVRRFLRKHGVRVAMGEYLDWSEPWLRVAQPLGVRIFGHAHGYDVSARLREPRWRAEYLKYNQADGVITTSEISKKRLMALGLDASRIHVIPCGVNVPKRSTRAERDTIRCLAVGRMVAKKAPILTLDAFRRAREACPQLRLDYVGAGELLPALQQFIRAFNLGEDVTLHGGQPHGFVFQLMREADIFLQHSMTDPETGDEEGLPVSILEAMAHGLPVVSTYHSGIPEAVQSGVTGHLVQEGDSAGMADAIVALARDFNLRHQMGEAGWRRANEHFSWEKERRELMRILQVT